MYFILKIIIIPPNIIFICVCVCWVFLLILRKKMYENMKIFVFPKD